jgi:hypothetical protein
VTGLRKAAKEKDEEIKTLKIANIQLTAEKTTLSEEVSKMRDSQFNK